MELLRLCDACGERSAIYHCSASISIFGPQATKTKRFQIHLCPACELRLAQVLTCDRCQRQRLAQRLTGHPAYLSTTRAWKPRL